LTGGLVFDPGVDRLAEGGAQGFEVHAEALLQGGLHRLLLDARKAVQACVTAKMGIGRVEGGK
jgi:hypothetical protein